MHVAKDLPSSDFKTVISGEWNLHRPGQCDLDDLMFWSVVVLFILSPVRFGGAATQVQLCFGGTYCGKESC